MTGIPVSARDRRILAIGGAVILVILLFGRGIPTLRSSAAAHRRSAEERMSKLARAEWLLRHSHALDRELARTRRQLVVFDSALVAGETPNMAAAGLAAFISGAASDADARLGSIRLTADSTQRPGELARVTAHTTLSGDLLTLASVMASLEQGPQLLSVTEMSISSAQPSVARTQAEQLQAELTVEGLYRRATIVGASR